MSFENPPHNKQPLVVPLPGADNVFPLRGSPRRGDEFFDVLSSPLEEPATLPDDEWRRRRSDNILALLEANERLRALAVKLSGMLEDLPSREWECAIGAWNGEQSGPEAVVLRRNRF